MPDIKSLFILPLVIAALALGGCSMFGGEKEDVDPDATARQLYDEAHRALNAGEYETAVQKFESLEARYPFGPYAEQAQLEIAYAYYKFNEPDAAVAAVDRFLRLHPRHEHVPYALYLKGLAYMERGESLLNRVFPRDPALHDQQTLREAFRAFRELSDKYPDSRYAQDADRRLLELRNEMAEHELYVADYYYRRGAWLAAVNRAQTVLERYQGSPSMPPALEIMVKAYRELGMTDLAADAFKVLQLNYPERAAALEQQ